ncbi:hypothetical protein EV361DRAFT_210444 [Lentinula raphanica]|uniref:Uncharacterized protein n=1 Tax=Lentinula raphanica TaxID=153919 RepID=A0AA38PJ29_9AGAR|nr:hypothetical protein F5878DRAFT_282261 [Lentinula raphanica]KAJ3976819.1 hypothetical protein EV361DRAFT_210444 [Lentinula raphanica]
MEFSPTGEAHPDVIQRTRKFRAFDEPEKKQVFQSFIEYQAPHKPPPDLGKTGDVFLNTESYKMFLRLDTSWAKWDTSSSSGLAHPQYPHRYLWIMQISGQPQVEFVPLSLLKKFKILNKTNLLKAMVSSNQKQAFSRKRRSEFSLNTRNGKKGRLNNIEPPSESISGTDVRYSIPTTSVTPIQHSIFSSSASPSSTVPHPSILSLSNAVPPANGRSSETASPPAQESDRQLRERNEFLEKEIQELRLSLRISREMAKDSQATQATTSTTAPDPQEGLSELDEDDSRQPQLRSPPPTPSISPISGPLFHNTNSMPMKPNANYHHHPSPSHHYESVSSNMEIEDVGTDFNVKDEDELEDKKPTISVKSESVPASGPATVDVKKEYIDLTFSDDEEPSNSSQAVQKSSHGVNHNSYKATPLPSSSTAHNDNQSKKSIIHPVPSPNIHLPRATSSSRPEKVMTSIANSRTPLSSKIREHLHASKPQPTSSKHPTPTITSQHTQPNITAEVISDDDDILEITPNQFRKSVRAGKRKATESSNGPNTFQTDMRASSEMLPRPLTSIAKKEEPQNVQIPGTTSRESIAAATANTSSDRSRDSDDEDMANSDFDLTYPEDEPPVPAPAPAPIEDNDVKMEDVGEADTKDASRGSQSIAESAQRGHGQVSEDPLLDADTILSFFKLEKDHRKCMLCGISKAKEWKRKFPVDNIHSMRRHLEIHRDNQAEMQNIQNIINAAGSE